MVAPWGLHPTPPEGRERERLPFLVPSFKKEHLPDESLHPPLKSSPGDSLAGPGPIPKPITGQGTDVFPTSHMAPPPGGSFSEHTRDVHRASAPALPSPGMPFLIFPSGKDRFQSHLQKSSPICGLGGGLPWVPTASGTQPGFVSSVGAGPALVRLPRCPAWIDGERRGGYGQLTCPPI